MALTTSHGLYNALSYGIYNTLYPFADHAALSRADFDAVLGWVQTALPEAHPLVAGRGYRLLRHHTAAATDGRTNARGGGRGRYRGRGGHDERELMARCVQLRQNATSGLQVRSEPLGVRKSLIRINIFLTLTLTLTLILLIIKVLLFFIERIEFGI